MNWVPWCTNSNRPSSHRNDDRDGYRIPPIYNEKENSRPIYDGNRDRPRYSARSSSSSSRFKNDDYRQVREGDFQPRTVAKASDIRVAENDEKNDPNEKKNILDSVRSDRVRFVD